MVQRVAEWPAVERPRYLEAAAPVVFPEEAEVPESQLHFELRILLYELLCDYLGPEVTVGSDQFVYYDAADPKRSLAPDVYLQLRPPQGKIRSWKTWERGAPDVAVEIISESDAAELPWETKFQRYHSVGVRELVRFDPEASGSDRVLRVWDRVDGVLLEREIEAAVCPSLLLDLNWVVAPAEASPVALRVTQGRQCEVLVPTRLEAREVEAKAREAEAKARKAEAKARKAAETRVRELEAELQRRSNEPVRK